MNQKITTKVGILLLILMMGGGISCENERTPGELLQSLEGEWNVEENSEQFGETAYDVTIFISDQYSSKIFISGFYHLPDEVDGNVEGHRINLVENQTITDNTISYTLVSGSGRVSDSYKYIQWNYKVDDGSGEIDEVTATYTKE
ncbi:MAG: hypothetical protein V5A51_07445 [Bacteroidales bacterium]